MKEDTLISIEKMLNPEVVRSNLITVSIYITAFEVLKGCILDRPKEMFSSGFNKEGLIIDEEKYRNEVLALNRSPIYASLHWFKILGIINDSDIEKFTEIKNARNKLVHELPNFIYEPRCENPIIHFKALIDLVDKIEKWWIYNIEIPTNPDFDGQKIDLEQIIPGPSMALHLLVEIALGNEKDSSKYYDEIKKIIQQRAKQGGP